MIISTPQQLQQYQAIGKLSTQILEQLHQAIKVGVTPLEIDQLADKLCQQHQVKPSFKGVGPSHNRFKHSTCISVNEVVVHGIPNNRPFQAGDIIKVDFGLIKDNLQTDHCFTLGLSPLSAQDERLIKVSKEAVLKAVNLAIAGNSTGDLGFAMQYMVEQAGFNIAKEFIGHGIGQQMHDYPEIPAYGKPKTGELLEEGMVLCLEAQVVAGDEAVVFCKDGWTVKTADNKKAGMFEYMVVVGKKKPTILTPTVNWEIVR